MSNIILSTYYHLFVLNSICYPLQDFSGYLVQKVSLLVIVTAAICFCDWLSLEFIAHLAAIQL